MFGWYFLYFIARFDVYFVVVKLYCVHGMGWDVNGHWVWKREENDEDEATGIYDSDERPIRNIEREFRDIVQLLEPGTLGEKIWEYVINNLTQKQRQSLWRALTILAEELPTNVILPLLEQYRDSIRRGKASYVNAVCRAVIKGSTYPMATALHLARYMDENASRDLARYDTWTSLARTYEEIAI